MNIVPFQFENKSVRVVKDENGDPWFVAADVCAALGLDDTSKACSRLDVDERGTNTVRTPSGDQNMLVINESGMYSLTLTSRKDEAKRFKKWVTSEVLPSIRKTGSYSSYNVVAIPNFSNPAEAARTRNSLLRFRLGRCQLDSSFLPQFFRCLSHFILRAAFVGFCRLRWQK